MTLCDCKPGIFTSSFLDHNYSDTIYLNSEKENSRYVARKQSLQYWFFLLTAPLEYVSSHSFAAFAILNLISEMNDRETLFLQKFQPFSFAGF
ncbi:hypothetical protein CDAR_490721 [Caerostris darwini]|uniref:Uncharacterized protein n=1 Tax=Caerostris darwini TaxID=1538125 RepID=A0AAV4NKJ6_9ARAC|nr:hypothetical protein CDAR_490721 [Caerostris darwini]